MEHAILGLALLLILAKVTEGLATRLHQSPLVAYVLTGILLGPVLGLVTPGPELSLFFGIGVLFLFFLVGVEEIDISSFVATLRGRFFIAAAVALIVPLAASFGVLSLVLEMRSIDRLAVAGLLSLSSLGIATKVLSDLGQIKKPMGLEIFTTVVIVELLGLLLVGFTLQGVRRAVDFTAWDAVILLGQIVVFALVAWLLASRVFPPVVIWLRRILGSSQLAFGLLVGGLFLTVVGAEALGLHGSLGALLFGMALTGLPHRLRAEVMPGMRSLGHGLFVPLFFASAGLHLSLSFISLPLLTILAIVLVAVAGKFAGAALGAYVARLDSPFALASGILAKGVVEIALLVTMLETGIIPAELFSLLTLIMLAFMFVVPPIMKATLRHAQAVKEPAFPRYMPPSFARYALDNLAVKDVMDQSSRFAPARLSVRDFLEQWVVPEQQDYLVIREDGRLAGIISLSRVRLVPKDLWEKTLIGKLARPRFTTVGPDEPLDDALERMVDYAVSVLPVIEPRTRRVLGAVTSRDVYAAMTAPKPNGSPH